MATEDRQALVAREIAYGSTIAEVARRHHYSWKGMKKLVATREMQQLVQAERQRIGELGEQCRARLFQLGPQALDIIAEVLGNRRHPKRLETARFVVEKILPNRTMLDADVNVRPSVRDTEAQARLDDVMIEIGHHLQQLREAQAGGPDPLSRVRLGSEVLHRLALPDGRGQ